MNSAIQRGHDDIPAIGDYAAWYDNDRTARFVADADKVVLAMNDAAQALMRDGHIQIDAQRRLHLPPPRRAAGDPLQQAAQGREGRHVYQLSAEFVLAVIVAPIRHERSVLHISAAKVALNRPADLGAIVDAFGITECEGLVLNGLAQAVCPKEISRSLGLSIHTIRSHQRSIYSKIGARSAAEAQKIIFSMSLMSQFII